MKPRHKNDFLENERRSVWLEQSREIYGGVGKVKGEARKLSRPGSQGSYQPY